MEGVERRNSTTETTTASLEELYEKLKNLKEHECIAIPEGLLKTLKTHISYEEPNPDDIEKIDNLGLYLKFDNGVLKLHSYYFIGAWWFIEDETYIRVWPKKHKDKYANPIAMLLEIVKDSEIISSSEFKNTFRVNTSSSFIELESEDKTFMLFLIIGYLYTLEKLVRKGLRRGYLSVEDSLNGRVKGKILTKETYQKHLSKGIYTKTVCKFPLFTENFLENQILKSALVQASRYILLINFNNEETINLINFLSYAFEKVSLRQISELDFLNVRHSLLFPEYKEALKLAKLILKTVGYDPFGNTAEISLKSVPPYMINMPKLFELYVWKRLKEKYGNKVKYQFKFRGDVPDFLIEGEGKIIDAKYKYIENLQERPEDIAQLSRYGRNKKFREIVCNNEEKEPELIIAYPTFGNESSESIKKYYKISKQGYAIPHY
ncbi:5-methylcytosine restriction system specificity protein McrC [Persephonella sp.]